MENYKFMVVGGGTSGLSAAIRASRVTRTALVEHGVIGGTCLNTGCIPTKAMIHASHLYSLAKGMDYFGIKASPRLDFKKVMDRVNSISKEGRDHINAGLAKNKNLVLIRESAEFIGPSTIKAGSKRISADKIIIATGAWNFIPPVKGIDRVKYLDNESVLGLKELPRSIVMIGGGYISLEYATFFSQMGCKVTILELMPKILPMLDDDAIELITQLYSKKIRIMTNTKVMEVSKAGEGIAVGYAPAGEGSKAAEIKADKLFLATGRIPNTKGLGLEKANVKLGQRGEILVNKNLQSTNRNIYAIGDVNGKAMFAHAAKRQINVALENALNGKDLEMDFSLIPWAVFTNPPVAGIGATEKTAKNFGVLKANFKTGRSKIIEQQDGFVKVLYDKATEKIIGATIVGANADDIIHEYVALINAKATVSTFRKVIHIHPTLAEASENL